MARLNYSAPGVYVEEIPSARQPIAGVGTNTAGFIGIVPNTIFVPVANPDYDPVLSRDLLDFARLNAQQPLADTNAEAKRVKELEEKRDALQARVDVFDADIAELNKSKPGLEQAFTDAEAELTTAKAGVPDGTTPDDATAKAIRAAQKKLNDAKRARDDNAARLDAANTARQPVSAELAAAKAQAPAPAPAGAAAPGAAVGPGAEKELEFEGGGAGPDAGLRKRSALRPYYLAEFAVRADEFATKLCTNFSEYTNLFGDFSAFGPDADGVFAPLHPGHHMLTHAVNGFFNNGGTRCFVARVTSVEGLKDALKRFESIDDVAILAAPGLPKTTEIWEQLETFCESDARQNVFAILDSPGVVNDGKRNDFDILQLQYESLDPALPRKSTHAAYYFPHIEISDPAKRLQDSDPAREVLPKYRGRTYVAPSGHIAGIYARTDEERGVHKAPANTAVRGALEVKYYVSKPKQEMLNPQGVNCIRLMNGDVTVWGARTIGGDRNAEWKYISVRRFAGFLEESIDRGTQWVVFEPNDTNLWSRIILNITAFLTNVWRSGALFGLTPQEAFYVKCDAELNPPEVRDLGQVITEIGVSIVRPAEFVIFRITQSAGEHPG